MYQLKKTAPPIRDFMDERSLKLTKIFNLNLDCQNLLFRGSLASSKLNLFLFPKVKAWRHSARLGLGPEGRGSVSVTLPEIYELCYVVL